MSRIFDDLKRGKDGGPERYDPLDLFDYAARKQAEEQPPPPPPPPPAEPEPPREEPVQLEAPQPEPERVIPLIEETPPPPETAPSLFHRSVDTGRPVTSVLEPLTRFRQPWLFRDQNRWLVVTMAVVIFVVVVALIVLAVRSDRPERAASGETVPAIAMPEPKPVAPAPVPVKPPPPAARPAAVAAREPARTPAAAKPPSRPKSFGDLEITGPGIVVKSENGVKIVMFERGIFLGSAKLGPEGRRSLDALSKQLAPFADKLAVTVIGCTDNVPMNRGSRYADNQELGLARAAEVARHLESAAKIPSASIRMLSYGERWSPYPNDTPDNRARNRTAVLRISAR